MDQKFKCKVNTIKLLDEKNAEKIHTNEFCDDFLVVTLRAQATTTKNADKLDTTETETSNDTINRMKR